MLHNFGGTDGIYGRFDIITTEPYNAFSNSNNNMIGIGITMEGINQNYILYKLMLYNAWRNKNQTLNEYLYTYLTSRYDYVNNNIINAWNNIINIRYLNNQEG